MAEATNEAVLQEQNAQYKKDLEKAQKALAKAQEGHEKEVATLKEEHAKETATLKQKATELQDQLTDERTRSGDLAADLNESEKLTEELQSKLATASLLQDQSDTVIVSDGTHHYKVLAPKFKHKHVEYTSADLKTNEALVQELVARGIGFLQKIETEE
jgi:chromosome segregation ATPase